MLYVPLRNQHLIRTSFPTSWGFQPLIQGKLESGDRKAFGELFKKMSTVDPTPYICVQEALKFRELTCGSEAKIRDYCENIAEAGGRRMAEILGTEVMDNKTRTLSRCCFVDVRLPLNIAQGISSYDNFAGSEYGREVVNSQLDGFGYVRAADAPDIAK